LVRKTLLGNDGPQRGNLEPGLDHWSTLQDGDHKARDKNAIQRFKTDIGTLMIVTKSETPPKLGVRSKHLAAVWFAFGDASEKGFGVCLWVTGTDGIDVCYGTLDQEVSEESYNYRESLNLVLRSENFSEKGLIAKGTEIFTDKWVMTERCFFKGTSRSSLLFELVLRLRTIEMKGDLFIHLVWVTGTRMIEQGTDGLFRGDLSNGVMAGYSMLFHVPLTKDAFSRSPVMHARLALRIEAGS
jgi:hypothetical protein